MKRFPFAWLGIVALAGLPFGRAPCYWMEAGMLLVRRSCWRTVDSFFIGIYSFEWNSYSLRMKSLVSIFRRSRSFEWANVTLFQVNAQDLNFNTLQWRLEKLISEFIY